MEITLEEIQKKFASLPEDLQWAIMGAKVDDNIIEIGNKENLTVAQMSQLSLETYMVMYGFTPTEKFEASLKGSLGLPEEKNRSIVMAVNEKILKQIREQVTGSSPQETQEEIPKPAAIVPPTLSEIKQNQQLGINRSGIKINPPSFQALELMAGANKPKEAAPSPLEQKFSNSFQTAPVKTEHTLNNLSKPEAIRTSPILNPTIRSIPGMKSMSDIKPTTGPVKAYPKDPYRLSPEE